MSRNESSVSQSQQHEDQTIGNFVVKTEIGKGSFAVVHKGYRIKRAYRDADRESGRDRDRDPEGPGGAGGGAGSFHSSLVSIIS